VLGAIATEVSLLVTGVALNFAYVSPRMTWSSSPSLDKSSVQSVPSLRYIVTPQLVLSCDVRCAFIRGEVVSGLQYDDE